MASSACWDNLVLVATVLVVIRAETHPSNSNLQLQVTERLLEISNVSSNEADSIILETNQPVMALGGFSGSDPILTTSQLAALVKSGEVRYFLLNGSGNGGPGGSGQSTLISWITQHSKVISSSQWQSGSTSSASSGFGGSEQLYEITSAS